MGENGMPLDDAEAPTISPALPPIIFGSRNIGGHYEVAMGSLAAVMIPTSSIRSREGDMPYRGH